jgi:arginase family protein
MGRYGPPDAFEMPRFSGPRTFMASRDGRHVTVVDEAVSGRRPYDPARRAARPRRHARAAALLQLDVHHDLWDEYFGQKLFHGSVVRRALEEGLIRRRALSAGGPARFARGGIGRGHPA